MVTAPNEAEPRTSRDRYVVARLGDPDGLLLAGPRVEEGAEVREAYEVRMGTLPSLSGDEIFRELHDSGLQGRGGGSFPLWRKLQVAIESRGEPLLVVNCSESEPASRKDWTICSFRPHTVVEGAAAIARVLGAAEVVIHLHRSAREPKMALCNALIERGSPDGDPAWRISYGADGYVAGEASAVARQLHEGVALPLFTSGPLARRGPNGRPTVVSNAETAAQVAIVLRLGAQRWRGAGTASLPGPQLLTLTRGMGTEHMVVELLGQATIGAILESGGVDAPPQAVLVGGYAGTWIPGDAAWHTQMEPSSLRAFGAARGCGLIGVLPHGACGISETARIVAYLAGESAGQCGPCVHGLPVLEEGMRALASATGVRRALRRIRQTAEALPGSGACSHPDGVARLVASALDVFNDELVRHRKGAPCRPVNGHWFPLVTTGVPS